MREIAALFRLAGEITDVRSYGNGHINETYLVTTTAKRYILQRINHRIFKDVSALMENIGAVSDFLAARDPNPRHVLTPIRTNGGALYAHASTTPRMAAPKTAVPSAHATAKDKAVQSSAM